MGGVYLILGKKIPAREQVFLNIKIVFADYSAATTSRLTITETSECTETAIS